MTNDSQPSSPRAEGGSPLPLVVALILGLFLAAYLVRANPSSPGQSGLTSPSSSTEDIMPAAFKTYLPWDPNGKDVKSGNLGLQYIVLSEGPKDGKKPVPTDRVTVHYEGRLATGEGIRPELLGVLDGLAEREGVDRSQLALAFVLAHPAAPIAIIGSQNADRIRSATAALGVTLDRSDVYAIVQASEGVPLP